MAQNREHIHLPTNAGDKIADLTVASIGTWRFIIVQSVILALWIVLLSQNRQATRDRKRDDLGASEVQGLYDNHEMLMKLNEQQLEILTLLRDQQARMARPVAKRGES